MRIKDIVECCIGLMITTMLFGKILPIEIIFKIIDEEIKRIDILDKNKEKRKCEIYCNQVTDEECDSCPFSDKIHCHQFYVDGIGYSWEKEM